MSEPKRRTRLPRKGKSSSLPEHPPPTPGESGEPLLQSLPVPPEHPDACPIVGLGASAGGLEALEEFFMHMPPDSGIAFVVITHLDPQTPSFLPALLRRKTSMPVQEPMDGQRLLPNTVVVITPGKALTIAAGLLRVRDLLVPHAAPLPIDHFFHSLAEERHEKAIGIILSGAGMDGTLGVQALKSAGGMVMVQEAASAKFSSMPESALGTGLVDFVLPPARMPDALVTYVREQYRNRNRESSLTMVIPPTVIQDILSLIQAHTGHSFAAYKVSTVHRRLERRLQLHQLSQPELYVRFLREHPEEIDRLFQELLIGVTTFFRDPAAFDVLATTLLPSLISNKKDGEPVRIWVPACSTGEEAYSLAILLHECLESLQTFCPVQIFATDLDAQAIDTARRALYPESIVADVGIERLQRYFRRERRLYQIAKHIREMVIFAPHNLLSDPPFMHLDLLSCRNLLIYLEANAQQQLLALFHYALRPGGGLMLGTSETVGNLGDFFTPVDRQWKIFLRTGDRVVSYAFPYGIAAFHPSTLSHPGILPASSHDQTVAVRADAYLAQRYAPPSVVITSRGDIVHFHGRTGAYLEPPRGEPHLNIFRMAREGLEQVLALAVRAALAQGSPVIRHGVAIKTDSGITLTDIVVERVTEPGPLQGLLLVTFRSGASAAALEPPAEQHLLPRQQRRRRLVDLERELYETRASLQSTIEALESANAELLSANEELQSTNEEMQSANEELKTSKEEMQSLNEEMHTINMELRSKVEELSHANDDMANLLNSTDIATVFLDNALCIKRFTTQATRVIALIAADIGRPLSDLTLAVDYDSLLADARTVLRTLVVQEKEVCSKHGAWYLVRLLPYRTSENIIDGLVITFVNIDKIKHAEAAQQDALEQLATETSRHRRTREQLQLMSKVFMEATDPIIITDRVGTIIDLNDEAERVYGWQHAELLGQSIKTIVSPECHRQTEELLARCRNGENIRNVEERRNHKNGAVFEVLHTLSRLTNEQEELLGIVTIAKHLSAIAPSPIASLQRASG